MTAQGSKFVVLFLVHFFAFFTLALMSCSTLEQSSVKSNRWLPFGKYRQRVTRKLENKTLSFNVVLVLQPEVSKDLRVLLVGLSPFGSTVFRITDEGQPRLEIFENALEPHREHLMKLYLSLRPLFGMNRGGPWLSPIKVTRVNSQGLPQRVDLYERIIEIESYDSKEIPKRIVLIENEVQTQVVTTSYDFSSDN